MLATLIRLTGDFQKAEDALQDAFAQALVRWPRDGLPDRPVAWLITAARRKAIDGLRRDGTAARSTSALTNHVELERSPSQPPDPGAIADDQLRLLFTCCHPALTVDAQVALTLRTLCGLTTPEIARAFLCAEATMSQRIVRAKKKIREAGIPYRVPPPQLRAERLVGVLACVYLVFNEGYSSSGGTALYREDLCREATRLGRLLVQLMPSEPEVRGLLALMLLHHARSAARTDAAGQLVALDEQDRTAWDRASIDEGTALVQEALRKRSAGPYQIQAAIAALHGEARAAAETDWRQIALLYGELMRYQPGPVVELNRAVAVAMADGPERGLEVLQPLLAEEALSAYCPLHAAHADLLRRLGNSAAARGAYDRAIALADNDPMKQFLVRRRDALAP